MPEDKVEEKLDENPYEKSLESAEEPREGRDYSQDLKIVKYINDPVYGGIGITQMEMELIDTPIFQRLRGIRQLARVNLVFPGAEHSRYVHSIGVLHIMSLMTDHLMKSERFSAEDAVKMRAAALLHDIGHYPLSHLGESVYGYLKDRSMAENYFSDTGEDSNEKKEDNTKEDEALQSEGQQHETQQEEAPQGKVQEEVKLYEMSSSHSKSAHHEILGYEIVTKNNTIKGILEKYGLSPEEIGEIFTGKCGSKNMVYTQLLHSSLDADRLDYLLRDSYQTGVKYGLVDLHYLIRLLMVVEDHKNGNRKVLVCNKKGQHVVEHFLMSRYFHYSQVIHHKTNASFEGMIKCMYIKLLSDGANLPIFQSYDEIIKNINDPKFYNFNDAQLEVALHEYYEKDKDPVFKKLYIMYRDRVRPKVIYQMKDLYEESPSPEMTLLKNELKKNPEKITQIIGHDNWGYHVGSVQVEKIQRSYKIAEKEADEESLREAVKLYNPDTKEISYLAGDDLSIISKLSNYKSDFIRIYFLEESEENNSEEKHSEMKRKIRELVSFD